MLAKKRKAGEHLGVKMSMIVLGLLLINNQLHF